MSYEMEILFVEFMKKMFFFLENKQKQICASHQKFTNIQNSDYFLMKKKKN